VNHDIVNQNHDLNCNFLNPAALLISPRNKRKNAAEKIRAAARVDTMAF
jgi:hypothetical protein